MSRRRTEQCEGLAIFATLDNSGSLVPSRSVPSFKHFVHFDVIIGKPFEVAAPARGHFLFAANLIAVSIDESMIVAHQLGQTFNVVCVDAIDESQNGFFAGHWLEIPLLKTCSLCRHWRS